MDSPSPSRFPSHIAVGALACIRGRDAEGTGVIRFVGHTHFAGGHWVGLELVGDGGKNNGTVKGVEYFRCPENRGLFVRPSQILLIDGNAGGSGMGAGVGGDGYYDGQGGREGLRVGGPASGGVGGGGGGLGGLGRVRTSIARPRLDAPPLCGEQRDRLVGACKLKISHLMNLLNQQLELVEEMERAAYKASKRKKESNGGKAGDGDEEGEWELDLGVVEEIWSLTAQEKDVNDAFLRSLASCIDPLVLKEM